MLRLGHLLLGLRRKTATTEHVQRIDAKYEPHDTEQDDGSNPDAPAAAPAHGNTKPTPAAALAAAVFHIGTCLFVIQPHGLIPFSHSLIAQLQLRCN